MKDSLIASSPYNGECTIVKCVPAFTACQKMLANCRIRGLGTCLQSGWHVLANPCLKSLGCLANILVSTPALKLINHIGCKMGRQTVLAAQSKHRLEGETNLNLTTPVARFTRSFDSSLCSLHTSKADFQQIRSPAMCTPRNAKRALMNM